MKDWGSSMENGTRLVYRWPHTLSRNNDTIPKRNSESAATNDPIPSEDVLIPGKGKVVVQTGSPISILICTCAKIAPDPGQAIQRHIGVGAGGVDTDYRGDLGVSLMNHSDDEVQFREGDWIAQLTLKKISTAIVEEVQELDTMSRGASDIGSIGIQSNDAAGCQDNSGTINVGLSTHTKLKSQYPIRIHLSNQL